MSNADEFVSACTGGTTSFTPATAVIVDGPARRRGLEARRTRRMSRLVPLTLRRDSTHVATNLSTPWPHRMYNLEAQAIGRSKQATTSDRDWIVSPAGNDCASSHGCRAGGSANVSQSSTPAILRLERACIRWTWAPEENGQRPYPSRSRRPLMAHRSDETSLMQRLRCS